MAIARDNSANVASNVTTSPASGSFTCTGSNRFLLIGITNASVGSISAVTYGGVSATLVGTITRPVQTDRTIWLYGLENPASGANTLSVSFSGGNWWVNANSYTGVLQTGEPNASTTASVAEPGTLTATVTPTETSWLVGYEIQYNATLSAGTGTSLVSNFGGSEDSFWDSNGNVSSGSPQSLNVVATGGIGHDAMVMCALGQVASASSHFLPLLGVGK